MKKTISILVVGVCLSIGNAIAAKLDNSIAIDVLSNNKQVTLSTLDNNELFFIADNYTTMLFKHKAVKPIDYGGLSGALIDEAISQSIVIVDARLFNVAVKQNQNFERMQ